MGGIGCNARVELAPPLRTREKTVTTSANRLGEPGLFRDVLVGLLCDNFIAGVVSRVREVREGEHPFLPASTTKGKAGSPTHKNREPNNPRPCAFRDHMGKRTTAQQQKPTTPTLSSCSVSHTSWYVRSVVTTSKKKSKEW